MKKIMLAVITILSVLVLCSCSAGAQTETAKTYSYTKNEMINNIPIDFSIDIYEDGTYMYCESVASSYIQEGTWTVSEDILTLTDERGTNRFKVSGDTLIFLSENSDNYSFVSLENGDEFVLTEQ